MNKLAVAAVAINAAVAVPGHAEGVSDVARLAADIREMNERFRGDLQHSERYRLLCDQLSAAYAESGTSMPPIDLTTCKEVIAGRLKLGRP